MKTQFLNFGLIFVNNEYSIINDATIFTDDDAVILNFISDSQRNDYIIDNNIQITEPLNPDQSEPIS